MINIITVESNIEFIKKFERCKFLNSHEVVETDFRRIIERDSNAFKDEMSIKMMKEIDNAVRVGAYGVRTPFGKSCITCLSSGCKFGLLLWYYKDIDTPILSHLSRAGNNVWRFIAENFDVSFYAVSGELYRFWDMSVDLTIDGVLYTEENGNDLIKLEWEKEEEFYRVTKEKERDAYDYFLWGQSMIYRSPKEEMTLKEFMSSIDPGYVFDGYEYEYCCAPLSLTCN